MGFQPFAVHAFKKDYIFERNYLNRLQFQGISALISSELKIKSDYQYCDSALYKT